MESRDHLETNGVEVLGVTDHSNFHSIYFFDPNGHRVELAALDPDQQKALERLNSVKWDMLEEWSRTKRATKYEDWLHAMEFETSWPRLRADGLLADRHKGGHDALPQGMGGKGLLLALPRGST